MKAGFREFEFNLPVSLLASLVSTFDTMDAAPLTLANASELPEAQGVYQLSHAGKVVYIGKTDTEAGLRQRLSRHAWTIQQRRNLEIEEVLFRALRVYVFTAIDLESQLIAHYGGVGSVAWNGSGFGSNDPGRQRDTTGPKAGGFDQSFPIDLDFPVTLRFDQPIITTAKLLKALREEVPYIIRAEGDPIKAGRPHPDLAAEIAVESGETTARKIMELIVSKLPKGWQATLLPGRIILYQENRTYLAGLVIARSLT